MKETEVFWRHEIVLLGPAATSSMYIRFIVSTAHGAMAVRAVWEVEIEVFIVASVRIAEDELLRIAVEHNH